MRTVTSKDGTRIAYDKIGEGPAVILVNGALAYRAYWGHGPLAAQLADHFTVYTYDRRGRGESGDAVALFMTLTGASAEDVDGARQSPVWSIFEAVAPTLAYDHSAILGDDASVPTGRAASVAAQTSWTAVRVIHLCTSRQWRLQRRCPMDSTALWKARRTRSHLRSSLLYWWSSSIPTRPSGSSSRT